jgi:hypothetical protein
VAGKRLPAADFLAAESPAPTYSIGK